MALQVLIRNVLIVKQSIPRCLTHLGKSGSTSFKNTVKYICNSSVKQVYQDYFKVSQKGSDKLKLSDGVPAVYSLIYNSPLDKYLKIGYPVMLFFSVGGPSFVFYQYYVKGKPLINKTTKTPSGTKMNFINPQVEVIIYLGVMCVLAATAFAVMFKIPFRIYKHQMEHKYIAVFLNPIPAKVQLFHFTTASQTVFKNPLYFFCDDAHYLINKKKAIIFEYYFRTPGDLCDMLGVD